MNKASDFAQNKIMKKKSLNKPGTKKFGKHNQFDINGSYTGTSSLSGDLKPVQDADDL